MKEYLYIILISLVSCQESPSNSERENFIDKEDVYLVEENDINLKLDTSNVYNPRDLDGIWLENKLYIKNDSLWTRLKPGSNDLLKMELSDSCYTKYRCDLDGNILSIVDSAKRWFISDPLGELCFGRFDCSIPLTQGDSIVIKVHKIAYLDSTTLRIYSGSIREGSKVYEYIKN
ncbi:MAG: hypothetical protein JKY53_03650 [Flavobacteriales bacterium]|nr:hypothetical protein [Flavobacteriales bacterium]